VTTVAFCLLTYRPDHPSGIERSIAALVAGCRELGVTPLVLAAGPAADLDAAEPGLIRLASVQLPRPARNEDVLAALADPAPVVTEVSGILADHRVDVACWADTLWGLGYLNPAPPGVRTVLMAHKIRSDERWFQALAAVDVVCPASSYLAAEAISQGQDTTGWHTVPNALLDLAGPVPPGDREQLRTGGPIRIVSRAEPEKALPQLLRALPAEWSRPVELVLARADFEFWPGMQQQVIDECRAEAARRRDVVRILPALGWREVQPFFAGAAATVVSSTEPETFCHTAAEALSVGTPVVAFDIGNVPALCGPAGQMVDLAGGADALWAALAALLSDKDRYHGGSQAAAGQVAGHSAAAAATALLAATTATSARR
jgi:glycosyltransferase involved in cell wall biosynthesis